MFLFNAKKKIKQWGKCVSDSPRVHSYISAGKEIHADVARIALQRVHADWIEFPILSSSDKVGVA